ncbi:MAG TPA: RNA methyltransferase [Firmicutes bacterium]|nr:RNA methyltransferase [Bacillota bacterium]
MKKETLELLKDAKRMKENRLFVVDTRKVFDEAAEAGMKLKHFIYSDEKEMPVIPEEIEKEKTRQSFIDRFAAVKSNSGFIAVFQAPKYSAEDMFEEERIVILDRIQDPSNAGAIVRSAAAYGINNFICVNSVNLFNEKAIRASAGNVFRTNRAEGGETELRLLAERFEIVITDVKEGVDIRTYRPKAEKLAIVFGNESKGVSEFLRKNAGAKIKISYPGKVESLNVAAAAAIIFHELAERE